MDKITQEVRIANWKSIIEQCHARPEGQSAKQWLADNGISEKSYYYWQRKVRQETYALIQPACAVNPEPVVFAEFPFDGTKSARSSFIPSALIYSAFRTQYDINLNTDKLHFWEFMGLLTTLDECAYTRVIGIRQQKIRPKMSAEEKKALKEAKTIYSLEALEELTSEEQEAIDEFMKYVKQGK